MKTIRFLVAALCAFVVLLLVAPAAQAQATRYILDYEGIPGSSVLAGYENKIELLNFSQGIARGISPALGGDRNTSAPDVSEVNVLMAIDLTAHIKLIEASLVGDGKTVKITGLRTGAGGQLQPFLEIEMTNTLISGLSQSGADGDIIYLNVSLNFTKIKFTTTGINPQTGEPGTPTHFTWDLETNTAN